MDPTVAVLPILRYDCRSIGRSVIDDDDLINNFAPYLNDEIVEADFDFFSRTLQGTEELRPRWKRAIDQTSASLGEALGQVYVERAIPPEPKAVEPEIEPEPKAEPEVVALPPTPKPKPKRARAKPKRKGPKGAGPAKG